ncbi:MAG: hypothetical protein GY861_02880 [bacterium]|nr:hypothetical protein [bacterium]
MRKYILTLILTLFAVSAYAANTVVYDDAAQTLTNKTIDCDDNTCNDFPGSGDVTSVGDCTGGACLDGTSDGGTWIKFYDAQGTGQIITGNITAGRVWTTPDESGTFCTTGSVCAGYQGVLTNSAGLRGALSDETGSGLSVFATSPQFTTTLTTAGIFAINPGGALTIGDGGDTLALDSSDWDIGSTGIATGFGNFTSDGTITGALAVINSATPTLVIKDSTAGDGDDNFILDVDATATASGTEDVDFSLNAQIAGTPTIIIDFDADTSDTLDESIDAVLLLGATNVVVGTYQYTATYTTQTLVAEECLGSIIYITGAGTIDLPDVFYGADVCFETTGAGVHHIASESGDSDDIRLDGTLLGAGQKISTNEGAGELACCSWEAANVWNCVTDGMADGGAN